MTCKANGNSIFLPAAGYQTISYYEGYGTDCYYWTSSRYSDAVSGYCLSGRQNVALSLEAKARYLGLMVRPVTTIGSSEGGGGDITGGHTPGDSQQTDDDESGSGSAGSGDTGNPIGD